MQEARRRRSGWWRRLLWSLGAGFLTGTAAEQAVVAAQPSDYRAAATAPLAWQQFSQQLQLRFADLLAANGKLPRHLQDYLAARGTDAPPLSLTLRSWISPAGNIERVEFVDLADDKVAADLRGLLNGGHVGVPPPEMPQPVNLRLSLRPPEPPQKGD
ncbi:hypothetical protein HNR60_003058 [Rhodopseudomonas rhenobacensis]|uniref:Uncharacterized protein n=1 Tax=Rhodopseudomonas rhenobacensis TaxID=87461 RepID=A0A7W7Z5B9_9BRAD|nr:hypothetical protein [Rhodopseudomonas rhenobacensis]MBB5048295.1 hypothetical protein [Rhodopseudomonas rhenobacensis]